MVKKLFSFIQKFYVAIIFLILYSPVIVLMVLSFNDSKSRVIWGGFTLKWYSRMFNSSIIVETFIVTVTLALLSAAIAVVLGTAACVGIEAMRRRNKQIVLGATNIPLLNADIVTGISLMLFFSRFLNAGFPTLLIAHITFELPYVILSIMPRMRQINTNAYNAALDLGATPLYAFFKIILPEIFPGIITGFIMALTMSLDDFTISYFTKGPGVSTLPTMIYSELRKGVKPEMYALSTLMFLAVLILLVIVNLKGSPMLSKPFANAKNGGKKHAQTMRYRR
ncbi:MAG: ABC transporter permease [Clostridiales bacterium]|nr:ABC transporter permease [Clostridiales bacterium]HOA33043.1 ABC transporter permease [Clostridiales bacterium]HOJ35648.1 ABC transporter permease [Clostridiales bacterium]HPP68951.1 ABC transporter permease [Clostridiales bacterium]HPU66544.1 ABC transporter permease [Clostridiales bacterium]